MKKSFATLAVLLPTLALSLGVVESGLKVGNEVPAFEPKHVTGPDKDTETCPVCKYGMTPAVQVWVNNDSAENIGKLAKTLEGEIAKLGTRKFKTFFIFQANRKAELAPLAAKLGLKNVALAYVPSFKGDAAKEYAINPSTEVKNTVIVYSNREVVKNYVNLSADEAGLNSLTSAVQLAVKKREAAN